MSVCTNRSASNYSQKATHERSDTEPDTLAEHKPPSKRGAPTDPNDTRVGAIAFGIEEKRHGETRYNASYEDQVQPVCDVSKAVEDIPQDGTGARKVQGKFISA